LRSLLKQLEDPSSLTRDSTWELAGQFERQCIDLGHDSSLYTLLKDQAQCLDDQSKDCEEDRREKIRRVPAIANWDQHFAINDLKELCEVYEENGQFTDNETRSKARYFLRHLHLVRAEEQRRDRAKIGLRKRYLARVTPVLILLLLLLCVSYLLVTSATQLYEVEVNNNLPSYAQPWPFPAFLLLFVFSSGALGAS
jgi:hypothetical protein